MRGRWTRWQICNDTVECCSDGIFMGWRDKIILGNTGATALASVQLSVLITRIPYGESRERRVWPESCLRVRYKMAEAECTRDQNIHAWRDLWWQHWRRGISCRHCVVWDKLFVAPRRDVSSWRNCCNYYTNWHFAVLTKLWVCNLSVISCFSNTKRGLLRFLPTWLPTHQHSCDQKIILYRNGFYSFIK